MPRILKQLLYGTLFLAVLGGILFAAYAVFWKPAPSCFDKKQNQGEEGIDCGRVCNTVCLSANLKQIEVLDHVRMFSPGAGRVELLAKIQNANAGLAARSFGYRFDLYDASNVLVRTVSGTSFIYAQEIKYIGAFADIDAKKISRAEFSVDAPEWASANDFERPPLAIQDKNIVVNPKNIEISGKAANNDTLSLRSVLVAAVFYDRFGLPAGFSETTLEGLSPGESRSFTIMHPLIQNLDPIRTELIPYAERP